MLLVGGLGLDSLCDCPSQVAVNCPLVNFLHDILHVDIISVKWTPLLLVGSNPHNPSIRNPKFSPAIKIRSNFSKIYTPPQIASCLIVKQLAKI